MSGHERADGQVQRADPRARRRAALLIVLATVAGAAAILLTHSWLDQVRVAAARDPRRAAAEFATTVRVLAVVLPLPILAFAVYGLRLAARTHSAQRFPPPGMAVSRDTRVLVGAAARARARLLQLLMAVLLVGALAVPVVMLRAVDALTDAAAAADDSRPGAAAP